MNTPVKKSSDELAQERTDLALRRTVMAMDRTLMAWVRTGLSIISFGFTIYKILDAMQNQGATFRTDDTPRNVGLIMVGTGLLSLVLGMIEYMGTVRALSKEGEVTFVRSASVIAFVIGALGIIVFIGISRQSI
jgi:putative membrane protein